MMTYYPLTSDFGVTAPSQTRSNFARMLGGKPLLIQEAGYPASALLGSSEAKQASFVDEIFDEVRNNSDRLLGVCFFLSVDFSDQLVDRFVKYYRAGSERFRAMLSTLGFKHQDGTPRRAWDTFRQRAIERNK